MWTMSHSLSKNIKIPDKKKVLNES
jgi:hypothetical protein